jgi:hypothetical protein
LIDERPGELPDFGLPGWCRDAQLAQNKAIFPALLRTTLASVVTAGKQHLLYSESAENDGFVVGMF